MYFDTHTHIYLPEFDADRSGVMARAFDAGVELMMLPNVGTDTISPLNALHEAYPLNTFIAMGLHPTEIGSGWTQSLTAVKTQLDSIDCKAVGEVGIDLYWSQEHEQAQMQALEVQAGWAVDKGLPLIIHCRQGLDQTLEVLDKFKGKVHGVFHSFGGSRVDVDRVRAVGDFYFGINGIVTFKNSDLRPTLPHIGIDRIVLETDSPYLSPVPHRGKRNESAFVPFVAGTVAHSMGLSIEETASMTTRNAKRLFAID